MITIKYELYENDFMRKEGLTKTFCSLEQLHEWVKDNSYTAWKEPYYATCRDPNRVIAFYSKSLNSFPAPRCNVWVNRIDEDGKCLASDGQYTNKTQYLCERLFNLFREWEKDDKNDNTIYGE